MTEENYEIIYSDLQTQIHRDGETIQIFIYRGHDTDWILELEDELGNSTVWEDHFATDEAALAEAINALNEEGIKAFVGEREERPLH